VTLCTLTTILVLRVTTSDSSSISFLKPGLFMNRFPNQWRLSAATAACLVLCAISAQAAETRDSNGNVGYDTQAECDAAVTSGKTKFYQPFTTQPALKRAGEADVKQMTLKELVAATDAAKAQGYNAADYKNGACDRGVGRSNNRDGVSRALIGKFIPYSPDMAVNVYFDAKGSIVRASMKQCDNNFSGNLPRPVGGSPAAPAPVAANVPTECYATVVTEPRFENREERVLKTPATKRYEPIAPTYKQITEQVLVSPSYTRQIPVPATYKTVSEEIVVRPESFREEPIAGTFKTVSERVMTKPESKRLETTPPTFKTASEKVMVAPERKEVRVIPATYGEKEETIIISPASVRVETIPATFKTVSEQVLMRAESVVYEPIAVPMKVVSERALAAEASFRLEPTAASYKTVSERVVVREASKRLEVVPAVFETITERMKVADATREWKRGRAWVGQALSVRPVRGFVAGADGTVDGVKVDTALTAANNTSLDDDVMCLVEVPEKFESVTRQVLKSPATTRTVDVPAEYGYVSKQVLDVPAGTRRVEIPAVYQTVTRQVIDADKLRAAGYKFDERGDITATPKGERVLRAADVAGYQGPNAASTAAAPASGASAAAPAARNAAASGVVGYVREIKIPAEFQTVTRQVVDQPARTREVPVPAITSVVKRRVELTPARTEEIVIPAVFRDVTRQVVDKEATTREIVVPAEFATIERRVVDKPASVRRVAIPAVKQTVTRQVIDQPASVREEVVPAVYKPLTRQVIDTPASIRELDVPAQFETITQRIQTSAGGVEQRAVLCETNATPAKIQEIQAALAKAGFNPGPINGVLRQQTMDAVNKYQQSKGLPVDGFLNLETVKSLGVSAF
jgi:Putative peptidoglycan binding domain